MIEDIKKIIVTDKAVIGSNNVMKSLKLGALSKIYIASNCPKKLEGELRYYSELYKTEIVKLDIPNDELGTICQKPYSILILGVMK
jgi:ribosomal protein L30E